MFAHMLGLAFCVLFVLMSNIFSSSRVFTEIVRKGSHTGHSGKVIKVSNTGRLDGRESRSRFERR